MRLCKLSETIRMRNICSCGLFMSLLVLQLPEAKAQSSYVPTGTLTCIINKPDKAFHFGSARPMICTLKQRRHPRRQRYKGILRKYGIEWGVFSRTVMRWDVNTRSGRVRRGGLEGSYGGATLEAALGRGVGGNVIGGGSDEVLLSPIGSQTQTGSVNVTTGVMRFNLKLIP
jgi:hypothetical protein